MSHALSAARRVVDYVRALERRIGQMERAAKARAVEAADLRDRLKRAERAAQSGQKD